VAYSHVTASRIKLVAMLGVLCALTFFHASPFNRDIPYDNARAKGESLSVLFLVSPVAIPDAIQKWKLISPVNVRA